MARPDRTAPPRAICDALHEVSTVLVAYDDSEQAEVALERGIEEARLRGGDLVVLAVLEMPLDPRAPRNFGTLDDIAPHESGAPAAPPSLVDTLAHARTHVEGAGLEADYVWAAGDPASEIIEVAKEAGAALIVVGEHHHGFLGRLFAGDVAAEVRREAGCDVIVAGASQSQ
jgi:nucleotide-binding universal stress UspA family protein